MSTMKTKLRFEGVVTLKTQEEADELVQAINTLINRGALIYRELEGGTSGDIENSLKASFLEMTMDQVEENQCKQVIDGMVQAEAGVQRELQAYRTQPPGFDKEACHQLLANHMQAFLARLAELCDMMEENQNKRGVAIIKHTVLVLEYLCDPKGDNFNTMLEHFEEASRRVLMYAQNRESVSPRGSPLQTKLSALVPRLGTAVPAVATASRKRRQSNAQEDVMEEKFAVLNLVQTLREASDIFTSEGRIQSSFDFSYEKLDKALSNLAQAVQKRSGAEVASQARVIVEAMKERKHSGAETAELMKATSQLLEATKAALASPNDQHAERLDKAVQGIRCQFLQGQPSAATRRARTQTALHSPPCFGLLAASADLTNCFAHLLAAVQDQGSPK